MAASSPDDCFYYAYMASNIALENLTPVILLTDAFIGNGASLWKLPKLSDMPEIKPYYVPESLKDNFNGLSRDELILFSPLKYYLPGFSDYSLRSELSHNMAKVDSLSSLLQKQTDVNSGWNCTSRNHGCACSPAVGSSAVDRKSVV